MKAQRAAALALLFVPTSVLGAERMVALQGHVPREVRSAALMGRAQPNETVTLSLGVRVDQALLDQTLADIYGPGAPSKKHYLSASEFAQKFGLAQKRQLIKSFAQANGLSVDPAEDRDESMAVKVTGPVGAVERAFRVHLNHYRGTDGKEFRAHDTDPLVPESLTPHLGAVLGLSNLTGTYHPHFLRSDASAAARPAVLTGGHGPGGSLSPGDIMTAYGLAGTTLTGSGQSIALVELDGYSPADVAAYKAAFALANTPVNFVSVDGTANLCGLAQNQACNAGTLAGDSNMVEVVLDIDMVLALASGASQVQVYTDINSNLGIYDIYNGIATDNTSKVASSSWGIPELTSTLSAQESQVFQRMAAQGQSMFLASGDNGAYDDKTTISVDDAASQPFVTAVGGTTLSGTVAAPVETAWNSCGTGKCLQSGGGSSGGGVSAVWALPSYQTGLAGAASATHRNVPDVALDANPSPGYAIAIAGSVIGGIGGTSAAAPLWAAFTALLNQGGTQTGSGTLGFANSTLYQIAASTSYATNFNDITSGDNGGFTAHAGYDNVTGLGSFKGNTLIGSLTGILALLAQEQLPNVYAYPNPWDTRKDNVRQVTIANLPSDASVKIYTLSGFWVKSLAISNGRAVWDLTNDAGERVASGLYFYTVNTPSAKTRGTIAIIK